MFNGLGFASVLLFIFVGTLLTVVVQSSSAASTITIALVFQGVITFEQGAAMILGENIGTTITAYLAALVGNISAKRAARAHLLFNVIGVFWMLTIFYVFLDGVDWFNMNIMGSKTSVIEGDLTAIPEESRKYPLALFHTGFNILNALLLIWFIPIIEKVVLKWVPDNGSIRSSSIVSSNQIVETPELAILEAKNELITMGSLSKEMLNELNIMLSADHKTSGKLLHSLHEKENITDDLEIEISNFLIEVAQQNTSQSTSVKIINMMAASDELESIGDLCYQTGVLFDRKLEAEITFGAKMEKGITDMFQLLEDATKVMEQNLALEFENIDLSLASSIEEKINNHRDELKAQNLKRLEKKEDKLERAILYRDLYNLLEKIGDKIYHVSKSLSHRQSNVN